MNVKTTAEILALSSTALREYAKELGVKRAANDTKATLQAKVETAAFKLRPTAIELQEIAAMKAKAKIRTKVETAARAPKAKKACTQQPCTRKVTENDMCAPHNEEGLWENTHSDYGHGKGLGEVEIDGCWICHPELNEATAAPRKSTSKAGMVILAKGTHIHKSELVRKEIEKAGGTINRLQTTEGGITILQATVSGVNITAAWDGDAFDYASASWDGKKYRNVKELVRLLAKA